MAETATAPERQGPNSSGLQSAPVLVEFHYGAGRTKQRRQRRLAAIREPGQNSIQLDVVHDSDRLTLAVLYDFGTEQM
jgi:hypothetical protein